jgi:hypothetical protein
LESEFNACKKGETKMKKKPFLLKSCLIAISMTLFLIPVAAAQGPALSPDFAGTWEVDVFGPETAWEGEIEMKSFSFVVEIIELDNSADPNILPNYFMDIPDTDDDFYGFVHGGIFAFYKENIDNCGGPDYNFGRDIVTGNVNESGTKMRGIAMGFDSNPEYGGKWVYGFRAKKISE